MPTCTDDGLRHRATKSMPTTELHAREADSRTCAMWLLYNSHCH